RETLEYFKALPSLQVLILSRTSVDDEGLKIVGGLTRLRALDLRDASDVTDAGVSHLQQLCQLEYLTLTTSALTDRAVEIVSDLPKLKVLSLNGQFTNKSL